MSYQIKRKLDYYETNNRIFEKEIVTFEEGLTVLVGCNGYGKSTTMKSLRQTIKDDIKKDEESSNNDVIDGLISAMRMELSGGHYFGNDKIRYVYFDHIRENNVSDMKQKFLDTGKIDKLIMSASSSEGENVNISFVEFFDNIVKMKKTLKAGQKNFILVDGVDSGLSIDKQKYIKEVFIDTIIPDMQSHNVEIYIVLTTNSYEFAENVPCMDAKTGECIRFDNYDSYRDYILKCAEKCK